MGGAARGLWCAAGAWGADRSRIACQQLVPRVIHILCIRQLRGEPRVASRSPYDSRGGGGWQGGRVRGCVSGFGRSPCLPGFGIAGAAPQAPGSTRAGLEPRQAIVPRLAQVPWPAAGDLPLRVSPRRCRCRSSANRPAPSPATPAPCGQAPEAARASQGPGQRAAWEGDLHPAAHGAAWRFIRRPAWWESRQPLVHHRRRSPRAVLPQLAAQGPHAPGTRPPTRRSRGIA